MKHLLSVLILAVAASASAMAADVPIKKSGNILVDQNGMTLYTFDKDTPNNGKSACNGGCATNWPPASAESGAKASGNFTVISRDDGAKQWAHQGKPLYLYKEDSKPGDRKGEDFKSVWHTVQD